MKKFTLIAACAAVALGAAAQNYVTENVSTADALKAHDGKLVFGIYLDENVINALGDRYIHLGPQEGLCQLDIWPAGESIVFTDPIGPVADGGYFMTAELPEWVGSNYWFGGGYQIMDYIDASPIVDNGGRCHIAFKASDNMGPVAFHVGNRFADEERGYAASQFSFCIGKNATEATSLAEFTDEWQALDIPVADFGKIDSNWNADAMKDFKGYIMSFNQGAKGPVVGANFSYDSVFFYTTTDAGIDNVAYDNVDFIVNGKVIEVLGANGIELFNLNGQLVKSTTGAAIDATNVNSGVYVVRAAGKASKVVL